MIPLIVLVLLAGNAAAGPPSGAPPPDDSESEPAAATLWSPSLLETDPAGFACTIDSLLAVDPAVAELEVAAEAYLEAQNDSLLLWDVAFAKSVGPELRARWWAGVDRDAAGFALRRAGDQAASAEAFLEAAEIYREVGHLRREAIAWGSLGVSRWYTGDMAGVKEAYLNALDARKRLGDPVLLGRTLNGLGSVSFQLSDFAASLDWYRKARTVRETLDNPADLGTTVAYIGNVQFQLGDLPGARATYREALEIVEGIDAPRARKTALNGLGNVHSDLCEYEEAVAIYEEQLAEAEANGDVIQAGLMHHNMGTVQRDLGNLAESLRELDAAAALQKDADPVNYTHTLISRGVTLDDLGDDAAALRSYRAAAEAAAKLDSPFELALATCNEGWVYLGLGAHERALAEFKQAATISRETEDVFGERRALFGTATVLANAGEYTRALDVFRQVQTIDRTYKRPDLEAEVLLNLGYVYAKEGKVDSALAPFTRAAEIGEELGLRRILGLAWQSTGHVYEKLGDLESARNYYQRAMDAFEMERTGAFTEKQKAALLGQRAPIYEAQVHVLAQLHEPEEAFVIAERGRARALLDRLVEARIDLSGSDRALAAEAQRIDRELSAMGYLLRTGIEAGVPADSIRVLRSDRTALEHERAELDRRRRLADPRFASLNPAEPLGSRDAAERLLKDNDVLLEYVLGVGDRASYLWVLTRDDLRMVSLPPRKEIEREVARLHEALAQPDATDNETLIGASATLDELLLSPAAGEIEKADRVFLVPYGSLHSVPFEVLAPAATPPVSAARGRFFVAREHTLDGKSVIYGPSATSLVSLAERERRSGNVLLAVGDPAFGTAELASLPQTRAEVEAIAALYEKGNVRILTGEKATESALRDPETLNGVRILHLATHGLVDDRHPERSNLVLAAPSSSEEDGYLRVPEIYALDLTATDLVVLSACETGLGQQVRGEGVLGLPRAFFYAGSPQVVVSLWRVSDRSTAELMASFYKYFLREKRSAAESLWRAKAELRQKSEFAHPFHWAAFVVMGAPADR